MRNLENSFSMYDELLDKQHWIYTNSQVSFL